ncbi:uncharacterized protein LOC113499880 [Trichoplusia ni]|uniref:Uncharacterized protein LOC113499880 n=1 Tax=Trichoplusia ni TaxID=7111 RepID=A0A7E5W6X8_TRINI|nr:uncharacterized protein LOC113499880 [Trichoplusia ni]
MQLISVLLYVVLASVLEESYCGIAKLKFNSANSFGYKNVGSPERINPEGDATQHLQLKAYHADKPSLSRLKRSDNVIEEENLGTTMSWYKVTWRYSRLDDNDSKFRNINS